MRSQPAPALAVLLFAACAQVREPTGGVKDTDPPRTISAEPAQFATNVQPERIVLRFNERVRLDRPSEHLLVSPPLSNRPDVRLSGPNTVVIELKAPLQANTTYSLNLGDAVTDLTEGNAPTDLTYVFSTGPAIDSSTISGTVSNAFTDLPEKDVLVMLYAADDDTSFERGGPLYFTRTRENGRFRLEHLRPAEYRIRALRDRNNDRRYDLPNEEIAFTNTVVPAVSPDSTTTGMDLRLFLEPPATQQLLSAKVTTERAWRIVLALPAGSVTLTPVGWSGGQLEWRHEHSPRNDTSLLWPTDTTLLDGREFVVSADGLALDTIRYMALGRMPFAPEIRMHYAVDDPGARTWLICSRPVARIDSALVLGATLHIDTAGSGAGRRIRIEGPEEVRTPFTLLPGAITDIYGGRNDTLRFTPGRPASTGTGTLEVDLGTFCDALLHPILQLLDAQGAELRRSTPEGTERLVHWGSVQPGSYVLKLIDDENGDGQWTPGSLVEHLPPERTWLHAKGVDIRAGWDVRIEWTPRPR